LNEAGYTASHADGNGDVMVIHIRRGATE
jgi:hypothetical protein